LFLLLAILCAAIVGLMRGGSLIRLTKLPLRCGWLILLAFSLQVVIFSSQFERLGWPDRYGVYLYVASLLLLLLVVGLNLSLGGMKVLSLGLALNFLVITANGGYMPVPLDNLVKAGMLHQAEMLQARGHFSNLTTLTTETRLPFLADIFVIPSYLPFRNVFSLGDVLIGIGAFVLVLRAMQRKR